MQTHAVIKPILKCDKGLRKVNWFKTVMEHLITVSHVVEVSFSSSVGFVCTFHVTG